MNFQKGREDMGNSIKVVFATGNAHKLKEVNEISKGRDVEFILPKGEFDPEETGETFAQNSIIKAKEAAKISNHISLADDSGLCVDALDGEPGIYSARYDTTPQKRIDKLLKNLAHTDNRLAKFVCAMTLVDKDGNILFKTTGECHGQIAYKQSGINGFGYDPVFIPDGYNNTIAELSEKEKNRISHRSIALNKVLDFIQKTLK